MSVVALPLTCLCTWFECVSMLVILLNCVTLGMYQPCDDMDCLSDRCKILQVSPRQPPYHSPRPSPSHSSSPCRPSARTPTISFCQPPPPLTYRCTPPLTQPAWIPPALSKGWAASRCSQLSFSKFPHGGHDLSAFRAPVQVCAPVVRAARASPTLQEDRFLWRRPCPLPLGVPRTVVSKQH